MQELHKRHYTHCNITLRVETVDSLKKWNVDERKATILGDRQFLRLLLLNIFGTKLLVRSSMKNLCEDKNRFGRGDFIIIHHINDT